MLISKYKTYFTGEITLHVAQIVNIEQLKHYIPQKHGLFQVYNCKCPVQNDDNIDDANNNKFLL